MARRSRAREVTLQLLFQHDHNPSLDRVVVESFAHGRLKDGGLEQFCLNLHDGVLVHLKEIDLALADSADNWRVARMAAVDRNVLRLGAFELLFSTETPSNVVMDEAIELARRFGSADSPGFVNGVLDRLLKNHEAAKKSEPRQTVPDGVSPQ